MSELTRNISLDKIRTLFQTLKHKLIIIKTEDKDLQYAKTLHTYYADAVYIALAIKSDADAIVTSNIKDFSLIFKSYRSEDI